MSETNAVALQDATCPSSASSHETVPAIWYPLNVDKHEIRVLTILPADEVTDDLSCTLSVISLDESADDEALSYTWGDSTTLAPMLLNGTPWKVTANLNEALRQMRKSKILGPIFFDALCIKQDDLAEKNIQVPLMDQVYKQAQRVHCWLGQAEEGIGRVIQILRQVGAGIAFDDIEVDGAQVIASDMESLITFFVNLYWGRAWIVQELLLAREAILHFGDTPMRREDLSWSAVQMNSFAVEMLGLQAGYHTNTRFVDGLQVFGAFNDIRNAFEANGGRFVDYLLPRASMQQASLPHDHIYAYLGLFHRQERSRIKPDYAEPISSTYTISTFVFIDTHQRLDFLEFAVCLTPCPMRLPTWVPNFSDGMITRNWKHFSGLYCRNYDVQADPMMSDDSLLGVNGACFDTVLNSVAFDSATSVISGLSSRNFKASYPLLFGETPRKLFGPESSSFLERQYIGGGLLEDAYWSSLTMYRFASQQPNKSHWLTPKTIQACKKYREPYRGMEAKVDNETAALFAGYVKQIDLELRGTETYLFVTEKGFVGRTTRSVAPTAGDSVCLFGTATVPYVLRPIPGRHVEGQQVFNLVSSAYVHGVMLPFIMEKEATDDLPATVDDLAFPLGPQPCMKFVDLWSRVWIA